MSKKFGEFLKKHNSTVSPSSVPVANQDLRIVFSSIHNAWINANRRFCETLHPYLRKDGNLVNYTPGEKVFHFPSGLPMVVVRTKDGYVYTKCLSGGVPQAQIFKIDQSCVVHDDLFDLKFKYNQVSHNEIVIYKNGKHTNRFTIKEYCDGLSGFFYEQGYAMDQFCFMAIYYAKLSETMYFPNNVLPPSGTLAMHELRRLPEFEVERLITYTKIVYASVE